MPGQRCLRILRQNLSSSHWKVISNPARSRPRSNPPIPLKSDAARKRGPTDAPLPTPFCAVPLACLSIWLITIKVGSCAGKEPESRLRWIIALVVLHTDGDMADVFTAGRRSAIMALVRSTGNASTERRLIELFREHGITGWRRRMRLPGKPDFVFRSQKVVVFVDGCFWHGCPRHGHMPSSRQEYWAPKLARNSKRDRAVSRELRAAGWRVIRVWECALTRQRRRATSMRIQRMLGVT